MTLFEVIRLVYQVLPFYVLRGRRLLLSLRQEQ
jgi:hypothetical protein